MPTTTGAAAARKAAEEAERRRLLAKLHRELRVPPPEKVAKLEKKYEDKQGNWRVLALDYLGHADLRDLLCQHDICWNWRPLRPDETPDGGPALGKDSKGWPRSLWIGLTIHGLERFGVGTVTAGKPDALKELIGDALRNAAQSFGIAVSLWSKAEKGWGDLPIPEEDEPGTAADAAEEAAPADAEPEPSAPPAQEAGPCPDCHAPPGRQHATACPSREGPQEPAGAPEPPAAPEARAAEPEPPAVPQEAASGNVREALAKAVTALKTMEQTRAFMDYRRSNGLPGDLRELSDEQAAAMLAHLNGVLGRSTAPV